MMRFLFRAFGCATIVAFFFCLTVYLLATTNPPGAPAAAEIRQVVYPAARVLLRDRFQHMVENLATGRTRQEMVVSDMEVNAYLDNALSDPKRTPLTNFHLTFREDETIRLRFNVSPDSVKNFVLGRVQGDAIDRNLSTLLRKGKLGRTFLITVDLGFHWSGDHPFIYLKHVYIGMLPLPLGELVNSFAADFNRNISENLKAITDNKMFTLRKVVLKDGVAVMNFEAKVTPEWVTRARMLEFQNDNEEIYRASWQGCPPGGCSPETARRLQEMIFRLSGKDMRHITMRDIEQFQRMAR